MPFEMNAQAAEKKKYMGTNKVGPPISRTVVSPGDDPKHELALTIRRDTTTSPDPDWNETEEIVYDQGDTVAGTGVHSGYLRRLHKNGDITYGSYEGTHKTTAKEDGWLLDNPSHIFHVHLWSGGSRRKKARKRTQNCMGFSSHVHRNHRSGTVCSFPRGNFLKESVI
jgi:hypothetical protein